MVPIYESLRTVDVEGNTAPATPRRERTVRRSRARRRHRSDRSLLVGMSRVAACRGAAVLYREVNRASRGAAQLNAARRRAGAVRSTACGAGRERRRHLRRFPAHVRPGRAKRFLLHCPEPHIADGTYHRQYALLEPFLVRPPIVVIDGETVDLFASVAHAERYLEPADVDDLLIFDADGLRLSADVLEEDVPLFFSLTTTRARVVIRATDPPSFERERLEELLGKCMHRARMQVPPAGDVAERAIRIFGFTE